MDTRKQGQHMVRHQLAQYRQTINIATHNYYSIKEMIHLQTQQTYITYSYQLHNLNPQKIYNQALSLQKAKRYLPIEAICWSQNQIFLLRRKMQDQKRLSKIIQDFDHQNRAQDIHAIKFICQLVKKQNKPLLNEYINVQNIIKHEEIYYYDLPILPSLAKSMRKRQYLEKTQQKSSQMLLHVDEDIGVNYRLGVVIIQILNKHILQDSEYIQNLQESLSLIQQKNMLQLLAAMLVKKQQMSLQNIIQLINDRANQRDSEDKSPLIRIPLIFNYPLYNQPRERQGKQLIKPQQLQLFTEGQNYSMNISSTSPQQINISIIFKQNRDCKFSTKFILSSLSAQIIQLCPDVVSLFEILQTSINNKKFSINKEGILQFEIVDYFIKNIAKQKEFYFNNNRVFPSCCNVIIVNQSASYRANFLGPLIILTTASAFYDRKKKLKYKKIYIEFKNSSKKYQIERVDFPAQYISSQDGEANKYNYGIAFLKQKIEMPLFYNLVYEYKNKLMKRDGKIHSYKLNINGHKLRKCEYSLQDYKFKINYKQEEGSSLLIQFEERLGMIGMVVAPQEVILFNQNHFYHIFRFIQRSSLSLQDKITFRSFCFQYFDFYQPDIPYLINNNPLKINNQKLMSALNLQLQVDKRKGGKNIPYNITQLQKILKIYLQLFGKDHWKISALNYRLGKLKTFVIRYNGINAQPIIIEIIRHFQLVVSLQKKYKWNLMFLAQSEMELATIFSQKGYHIYDVNRCLQHYSSAIKTMEMTDNTKFISNTYNNFAVLLKQQNKTQESITYYEKALTKKQQENDYEYISTIALELSVTYKQRQEYRRCINRLSKYWKNLNNAKTNNTNTKIEGHLWSQLRNQLTPQLLTSDQLLKNQVAQLIENFYPNDKDILKKKRKQNIQEVD